LQNEDLTLTLLRNVETLKADELGMNVGTEYDELQAELEFYRQKLGENK
jgi:hypothetical protein